MAPLDLDRLERLYEVQHSGRYRSDPELSAALDLIDSFPGVARELRVLRRIVPDAEQVCAALQSRGISFPALEQLVQDLALARSL